MAASPRLVAAIVIPVLSFAVGYLLGSSPSSNGNNHAEVLASQRELIRLLSEMPDSRVDRSHAGRDAAPRFAGAAQPNSGDASDGMRLPSLDPWMERIDAAVTRLEAAAKRGSAIAPPDPTDVLRRASRRDLPRNDGELKNFIREYEAVESAEYDTENEYDQIWDTLYAKYLYQSMEDLLDRFGRPDEISVGVGASTWEYYHERSLGGGLMEDWGVSLEFADGVLIDFHAWWNRAD